MNITTPFTINYDQPTETYTVFTPPDPVGWWCIGTGPVAYGWTRFAIYNRPTDEQIKNTEALLGWVWTEHAI